MVITSRQNARIKRIASLKEKKYRAEYGLFIVEGVKMVREAILSGCDVKEIVGVSSALEKLPPCPAETIETDENTIGAVCETRTPQGVVAVLKTPENKPRSPSGNCVILDGISDPGNLGTIIRTSAALGLRDVYLCSCADAYSPKTVRASMSGIYFVSLHECDRQTALDLTRNNTLLVADMDGESVFESDIRSPYAIVIGNEANGVSDFFRAAADRIVSIPMNEKAESLNAAVSFAVIGYTLGYTKKI